MSGCLTFKTNEKSVFFFSIVVHEHNNNKSGANYICTQICINFKVVFFADNFREFANLNVVYEELFKLNIFTESNKKVRNTFLLETFYCNFGLLSYSFTHVSRGI